MLEVHNYCCGYGQLMVLHNINLKAKQGEALALLGRNGAGKSTLLKAVMGLIPGVCGQILFQGRALTNLPSYKICRSGIGYVPEDRRIFATLSVEENLQSGRLPPRPGLPDWTLDAVYTLFPQLAARRHVQGQLVSGGEQQMLAIARTLMGNPALILIDEMSEGLAPIVVEQLITNLQKLKAQGLTLILSEQNMHVARLLAERVCIVESGVVKFTGSFQELDTKPHMISEFLSV